MCCGLLKMAPKHFSTQLVVESILQTFLHTRELSNSLLDFILNSWFLNLTFPSFFFLLGHWFLLLTIYLNLKSTHSDWASLLVDFLSYIQPTRISIMLYPPIVQLGFPLVIWLDLVELLSFDPSFIWIDLEKPQFCCAFLRGCSEF
jgi:hypothetical protein